MKETTIVELVDMDDEFHSVVWTGTAAALLADNDNRADVAEAIAEALSGTHGTFCGGACGTFGIRKVTELKENQCGREEQRRQERHVEEQRSYALNHASWVEGRFET